MGFTGRQPEGGADPVADQPGDLGQVWNRVIADLSGASAGSGAPPLSPQQRAFLRLTRPLGLIDGTALLAAPSEFAKDAIERILRRPISDALGRHLGVTVNLAVVVDASAASGGTEVPDPPGAPQPVARPRRRTPADGAASARGPARPTPAPFRMPDRERPTGRRTAARRRGRPKALARLRRAPPAAEPRRAALADPAEREVHLRHVRHRRVEPLQPRRGRRRRRGARAGVQPAVRLGRLRAGQDPPAARRRALRAAAVPRHARALRVHRGVHQRLHQLPARRPQGGLPAPLPRRRRAAGRRHPVPGGQGRHPGGVLPHLQHPAQREQADRRVLRPAAEAAGDPGGPDAHPVRVGPDHRHPAARAGDAHRDPAQEGRAGPARRARRRPGVHRRAHRAQHPRAGGRADPGHGVRVAEPAAGRHPARRDRAARPHPRLRRLGDHRRRRSWR